MSAFIRRVPAVLSAVFLAAHFVFHGETPWAVLSLAMIPVFFVRRAWAWSASCAFFVVAAVIWGVTAQGIGARRIAEGAPYLRMYLILGAVAALSLLSAWWLPRPAADFRSGE